MVEERPWLPARKGRRWELNGRTLTSQARKTAAAERTATDRRAAHCTCDRNTTVSYLIRSPTDRARCCPFRSDFAGKVSTAVVELPYETTTFGVKLSDGIARQQWLLTPRARRPQFRSLLHLRQHRVARPLKTRIAVQYASTSSTHQRQATLPVQRCHACIHSMFRSVLSCHNPCGNQFPAPPPCRGRLSHHLCSCCALPFAVRSEICALQR